MTPWPTAGAGTQPPGSVPRPRRIALIVIPTLSSGGAERVASILANEWSTYEGCEVHLAVLIDRAHHYELSPAVTVHHLVPNSEGRVGFGRKLALIGRLRRLVRRLSPDFCLSFMRRTNLLTLAALSGLGSRVIVSERTSPNLLWGPGTRAATRALYPQAQGLIAQTERAARHFRAATGCRTVWVIPNPVAVRDAPSGQVERERLILNVGRLMPEKGQGLLLQAFQTLNLPDWTLVILGEGPLRADLERQAAGLGIADRVLLPGAVPDVGPWLRRASIFAFPSLHEGFPNALAEAMISGLPVVSFDCETGPAELIRDGRNGILVRTGDVDALARHLTALAADPEARRALGDEASRIAGALAPEVICRRYWDVCAGQVR